MMTSTPTQVLDISNIDAVTLDSEVTQCYLHETLEALTAEARSEGLEITPYIDPALPDLVLSDPRGLRRMFLNLCSDAARLPHPGEVGLSVRLLEANPTCATVLFKLCKTSVGIPESSFAVRLGVAAWSGQSRQQGSG
jgi:signal transduction histidine kinase